MRSSTCFFKRIILNSLSDRPRTWPADSPGTRAELVGKGLSPPEANLPSLKGRMTYSDVQIPIRNQGSHKKNQVTMIPPKETNETPVTGTEDMDVCERSDKEFRIILLKKHGELRKYTDGKIREIMQEGNEKFNVLL